MFTVTITTMKRFVVEERGLAFTEYLILLGFLTTGVILALLLISGSLNAAWASWADWFTGKVDVLDGP